MISSEVQRTLVKSPPELWAEISDPDSLAKHLGDFGEISITRVDPEQKVEWQAGDTSGSVVIKPSGWGTKVKLTVTRPDPAVEPEPERADVHQPEAATEPETGAPLADDAQPAAAHVSRAEPQLDTGPAGEPTSDLEAELEPQPAGEAEPEMVAADDEPEVLEDDEPFVVPLEDELEHETELIAEFGPSFEHLPAQPLEARRGFFARLFGRFRGETVAQDDLTELPPLDEPKLGRETPDADDAWAEWAGKPATAAAIAEAKPAHAQPAPSVEHEPSVEHQPSVEPEPSGEPELSIEPTSAVETEPAPIAPVTSEHEADAESEPEADAESAPEPNDISAEIAAAEEVAAEQVTAVLTGVLDRLGAAHHRPFSRS
jgi:hypothetical protein